MTLKNALYATTLSLTLVIASPVFASGSRPAPSDGDATVVGLGIGNGNGSGNEAGRDVNTEVNNRLSDDHSRTYVDFDSRMDSHNLSLTHTTTGSYNDTATLTGNTSYRVSADQELSAEISNRGALYFNGGNGGDADAAAAASGSCGCDDDNYRGGGHGGGSGGGSSAAADAASGGSGNADYRSGSNSVNGSAFAAYAGILNQGWNTGINSNAQAATNIAAVGTVTFTAK
jgi:hypothetical protein